MMKPISMLRSIFTVGLWTLLSRVLGLVREIMILALIGPGPLMDAFVAAFRLPNMFRRFFAEGAFNAAFVPMFSKRLEDGDDPLGFAREAASGLALVLMGVCALALIFMPALVYATAQGFAGTEKFDLAVGFGRVMFPYIFFISLAALFSGMLNAAGHFAAAAAAPVLLNILIILSMVLARSIGGEAILFLVWAVPLAGIAQLILVAMAVRRVGMALRPALPKWTPRVKSLVVIALPAMLSGGVLQVNLLIGQQVASQFDNAISWLYSADRLYQLPLGVVGIAVGIVLLPDLSRRLKAGDAQGGREAFSRAAELAMALSVPASVALVVMPGPLLSALYKHGATDGSDITAMASALAIYGFGLPAFILQKLQQPLFYAREDTRTPFRFALAGMAVMAVVAIGLSPVIGWIACALATTVSAWVMSALLWWAARDLGEVARLLPGARNRIGRTVLAALVMGAILWAAQAALPAAALSGSLRYLSLCGLIMIGGASYGAAGVGLGAFRFADLRSALSR